ncbi:MAG TPA: chromate efflux transporter [Dehalococcoidia bacterium]
MTSAVPSARREVALLFLKLGCLAFGGPAAHIALMRREVVQERRWVSDERFLDLLGASNLIPGPSSTELAIYLGYSRAGKAGLVLAGVLFILPAFLIVLALAWLYARSGSTPTGEALLYGVKPVIIAIIVQALLGLGRTAFRDWTSPAGAAAAFALYLAGLNPLLVLFGVAGLVMAVKGASALRKSLVSMTAPLFLKVTAMGAVTSPAGFSYGTLFLTFLKIGAIVYGSGYVLLAYLRSDFVDRLQWLTDQQLLDAVAIGQLTPGPVFTTATFVGYLTGGWQGAVVATVAIFLPSFLFVAVVYPLVSKLRASAMTGVFLDGVNAAAIGLMAGVSWQLARAAFVDALTVAVAVVSGIVLLRYRVNSALLIGAGAAVGLIHEFVV